MPDRAGQIPCRHDHDPRSQGRRQAQALEQRLAQARLVAEAVKNKPKQPGREIDLKIGDERENRIELSGLGEGRGRARRQDRPARQRCLDGGVSGHGAIDEVGLGQHRRVQKHRRPRFQLVPRQGEDESARRVMGSAQGFRQRPAHQDRRIVGERGQGQRRFGAPGWVKTGVEIGARERARRLGPRILIGRLRPGQKPAHYIWLDVAPHAGRRWHELGGRNVGVHGSASVAGHGGRF